MVTHDLQIKTEEARHRIKVMRMRGEGSFASALIGAKSVGDLASRKFLYERIAAKDHKLFTDVKQLRELVVTKKKRQDQLVQQVAGLIVKQKNQAAEPQRNERGSASSACPASREGGRYQEGTRPTGRRGKPGGSHHRSLHARHEEHRRARQTHWAAAYACCGRASGQRLRDADAPDPSLSAHAQGRRHRRSNGNSDSRRC